MRPQSINIAGHSNGSHIEARVDQEVNLECAVAGGKPAVHIKWYRRGVQRSSGENERETLMTRENSASILIPLSRKDIRLFFAKRLPLHLDHHQHLPAHDSSISMFPFSSAARSDAKRFSIQMSKKLRSIH